MSKKIRVKDRITPREEIFCRFFTQWGTETFSNATLSAEKAGYKNKRLGDKGCELRKRAIISQRIDELKAEIVKKLHLDENYVVLGIISDQEQARKEKDWKASNACSKLLGEFLALFKQRSMVEIKSSDIGKKFQSEAEKVASIAAAEAYKLSMVLGGADAERSRNPVSNPVRPTTLPEQQPQGVTKPKPERELTSAEQEEREHEARYSHPLAEGSTGGGSARNRPKTSANNWK